MTLKKVVTLCLFAATCSVGWSTSIRNITSAQYNLYTDNQDSLIISESFIGKWFSLPVILSARADIRDQITLWTLGAGAVVVWPNRFYSELSYSFGFSHVSPFQELPGYEGASFSHSLYADLTVEAIRTLVTGGARAYYGNTGVAIVAFAGIRWYFVPRFNVWIKNTISWSQNDGVNDSIWAEIESQISDSFSLKIGGTFGSYRNPLDDLALGIQGSGILGWKWSLSPDFVLSYVFEYAANTRRDSWSNTLIMDFQI